MRVNLAKLSKFEYFQTVVLIGNLMKVTMILRINVLLSCVK